MRYMVVEFAVIPQNGVVGVVELQQMLQRSGGLSWAVSISWIVTDGRCKSFRSLQWIRLPNERRKENEIMLSYRCLGRCSPDRSLAVVDHR